MKSVLLAALLAAGPAVAQNQFLQGEDLQKEVARNCAYGCVVLSPEEVAQIQAFMTAAMHSMAQEVYEAAKQEAAQSCKLRT
jgi:hypothetical protein